MKLSSFGVVLQVRYIIFLRYYIPKDLLYITVSALLALGLKYTPPGRFHGKRLRAFIFFFLFLLLVQEWNRRQFQHRASTLDLMQRKYINGTLGAPWGDEEAEITTQWQNAFDGLVLENSTSTTNDTLQGNYWLVTYITETCLVTPSTPDIQIQTQFIACLPDLLTDISIALKGVLLLCILWMGMEAVLLFFLVSLWYSEPERKKKKRSLKHIRKWYYLDLVLWCGAVSSLLWVIYSAIREQPQWHSFEMKVYMAALALTLVLLMWTREGCRGLQQTTRAPLLRFMRMGILIFLLDFFLEMLLATMDTILLFIINGDPRQHMPQSQHILSICRVLFDAWYKNTSWFTHWVDTSCSVKTTSTSNRFDQCLRPLSKVLHPPLETFLLWNGIAILLLSVLILGHFSIYVEIHETHDKKKKLDTIEATNVPSISYRDALEKYLQCIPNSRKEEGTMEFQHAWESFSQWDEVEESELLWQYQMEGMTRQLIISRLTLHGHLDLTFEISDDNTLLYCHVTAQEEVLKHIASTSHLHLQVVSSLDPGCTFWQKEKELRREHSVYTRDVVKNKLNVLLMKGKINKAQHRIFPSETPIQWSRRVNALERKTRTTLVVTNTMPLYTEYVVAPEKQYLYERYPTKCNDSDDVDEEPSLFRTIDACRLIMIAMEEQYDIEALLNTKIISDFTALHDASSYDKINLHELYTTWIPFWKPVQLPGEPYSNGCFMQSLRRLYPFRQPLGDIRCYFGEKVAFYFLWIGFYAQMQSIPALVVIMILWSSGTYHAIQPPSTKTDLSSPSFQGEMTTSTFCIMGMILVWTIGFTKCWRRRSASIAVQWGMDQFEKNEQNRPQFQGTPKWNPITNGMEITFSTTIRFFRQMISCLILLIAASLVVSGVLGVFAIQGTLISGVGAFWGCSIGAILQSIWIQINSLWFLQVI